MEILCTVKWKSFRSHRDEITGLANDTNPLMIAIYESYVFGEYEEQEISINNYKFIRCNSKSVHTGEFLLYLWNRV